MQRTFIAIGRTASLMTFASLMIGGTIARGDSPSDPTAAAATAAPTTKETSTLESGIDQSIISSKVRPGNDFYQYANEVWLKETKIPSDKSNYGIFTVLDDLTKEQVRSLIEAAATDENAAEGSAAQKVGDMYNSVMDTERRNAAGIKPIGPLLQRIASLRDRDQLGETLGYLSQHGVGQFFAAYVNVDKKNSDQYAVYLYQSGLTMPDRDYYLNNESRFETYRNELTVYIADLLQFIGDEGNDAAAEAVLNVEREIAEIHWTRTENRDPVRTYNKRTQAEVAEMLPALGFAEMAKTLGFHEQPTLIISQLSFFEKIDSLVEKTPLETIRAYLAFKVMDAYASELTEELEQRHFAFHGGVLSGVTEQQPLWKRAVDKTSGTVGELVGQLYVDKHFKPAAKNRMKQLVENLKTAFVGRINTRDWMSEGTKKQALQKLSMFTTKVGFPDEWKDYTDLNISDVPLAENVKASALFEYRRELKKLSGPIDRGEWHMTPQTINAYYNPTMNEIVFPAAILQPPFFNMAADDAVNYGGIGAVIGHELSHGFDDKGSQYDGKGNLRMWWTKEDRVEFDKRGKDLVTQYNQFNPIGEMTVNGELTLGENIGDLGGLNVAYAAYRNSLGGKPAPVIDGLTGDQRFFLGWAQVWRRLYKDKELRKRLMTDPHSPSQYRVNGIVRNMDAFYEAFEIAEDDELYLAPEDRVRIW